MSASALVLLGPVQGSRSLRAAHRADVVLALRRALEARGLAALEPQITAADELIDCQTPECVERVLDAAGAELAIVPAIWSRGDGSRELTLTLLQGSKRSLNASGTVGDELAGVADGLVGDLLGQRAVLAAASAAASMDVPASARSLPRGTDGSRRPHAWMAGPAVLVAGGAAAFIAIGVGAATKNADQQMNTSAVAVWAALGAAAIGGGVAWWVVGQKRQRKTHGSAGALVPELALFPSKIDLRLRF
jgi:hypothetical protein